MTSQPPLFPETPDDGTLGAFAAGELSEAQSAEIRARAAVDPVLAARVEGALRVEAALRDGLREDGLLPVPLPLLAQVLERVRREASSRIGAPSRSSWGWAAAAAVLALFLGLAPAALGVESVAAAAEPLSASLRGTIGERIGEAGRALRGGAAAIVAAGPTVEALAPVSDRVPGGASALGAAGGVLLAAGLVLARRLGAGGSAGGAR